MWVGGWQNPGEWDHDHYLEVMSPGVAPFQLLLVSEMAQTERPPLTPP